MQVQRTTKLVLTGTRTRSLGSVVRSLPASVFIPFWGGYSGVFIDPDGHPWEVAHHPGWQLDEDGSVHLQES
jgi:hypothetical protein